MTPEEQTDLARQIVESPHWRYERGQVHVRLDGSRVVVTGIGDGGFEEFDGTDLVWWLADDGDSGACLPEHFHLDIQGAGALPDLDSGPTRGSLLGLDREVWGCEDIYFRPNDPAMGGGWCGWARDRDGGGWHTFCAGRSEIEAMATAILETPL